MERESHEPGAILRPMRNALSTLSIAALLAGAPAAFADHEHAAAVIPAGDDPHAACAAAPLYVPAGLLERPVTLRKGVGNTHEQVTTASAEAQAFYDQGLNYVESYVWIEAARSFHQALRLDPKLAMACVGLSRTHSGLDDPAGARAWLAQAESLAAGASDREQRRIRIRARQLTAIEALDDPAPFAAYKKALDDALALDMDDTQLWLLRGNAEEPNASGRGQRGGSSSIAFYEQVLKRVPDHASAHHFLVHSYETIGDIPAALAHGEQYARLSPAIPHAAHMWAHDLRRVGRVDDAIVQFKKAYALENAYYAAENIEPAMDWHHAHNLDLLAGCYQHKGQMALAEKTMRESAGLGAKIPYHAFNQKELPNFLVNRGRYADALAEAERITRSEFPAARSVGQALRGNALIGLGRIDDAQAALASAEKELQQVPRSAPNLIPKQSQIEPWIAALRAELLLRTGKMAEGSASMRDVVRALREQKGPDAWTQALFRLETIGRTAREDDRARLGVRRQPLREGDGAEAEERRGRRAAGAGAGARRLAQRRSRPRRAEARDGGAHAALVGKWAGAISTSRRWVDKNARWHWRQS